MAIYLGDWKDVNGVPFTPEGQVLHSTAGGGQVGLARAALSHNPQHGRLRPIQAYLYDRWVNVLTNFQKYLWYTGTVGIPVGRMGTQYPYLCGFLKYYSCCYAEVWKQGHTDVTWPNAVQLQSSGEWVQQINPTNQYVTFGQTFSADFLNDDTNLAVIYQMKPTKAKTPTCWRDTRLIAMHKVVDAPGYINYYAHQAQWPLVTGRTARFYFRIRYAGGYRREWSQSYDIPHGSPP